MLHWIANKLRISTTSGAGKTIGTDTDAPLTTDVDGTISGRVRGLVVHMLTLLGHVVTLLSRWPAALGQTTKSASLPVTLAIDSEVQVRNATHANFNVNASVQVGGSDVSESNRVPVVLPAGTELISTSAVFEYTDTADTLVAQWGASTLAPYSELTILIVSGGRAEPGAPGFTQALTFWAQSSALGSLFRSDDAVLPAGNFKGAMLSESNVTGLQITNGNITLSTLSVLGVLSELYLYVSATTAPLEGKGRVYLIGKR